MISIKQVGNVYDYFGLSTDPKPVLSNGSSFREIDTGKLYFFDGENNLYFNSADGSSLAPDLPDYKEVISELKGVAQQLRAYGASINDFYNAYFYSESPKTDTFVAFTPINMSEVFKGGVPKCMLHFGGMIEDPESEIGYIPDINNYGIGFSYGNILYVAEGNFTVDNLQLLLAMFTTLNYGEIKSNNPGETSEEMFERVRAELYADKSPIALKEDCIYNLNYAKLALDVITYDTMANPGQHLLYNPSANESDLRQFISNLEDDGFRFSTAKVLSDEDREGLISVADTIANLMN